MNSNCNLNIKKSEFSYMNNSSVKFGKSDRNLSFIGKKQDQPGPLDYKIEKADKLIMNQTGKCLFNRSPLKSWFDE